MITNPQLKPFQVLRKPQQWAIHLLFGYTIGVFYPMVPKDCIDQSYGLYRVFYSEKWIRIDRGWIIYCWQIRVFWFALGRHLPVCTEASLY